MSKACGALSKLRHCVDLNTLKNVYYALVHSYLRYGVIAWGNAIEKNKTRLNALLNRIVRIMTFAPFGIGTKPIFDFLKILDVSQVCSLETGKFIFKSKHGMLPISSIGNHFERTPGVHNHNLRNRTTQLVAPFVLLSTFKQKSIHIHGMNEWNEIPETIQLSESYSIFKKHYKSHLLQE